MKYDVTFKCGHTEVVELFGKNADREAKINYYSTKCVCHECYIAERDAEMLKDHDLVEMHYSEYKNSYSSCETQKGSYNAATKTIKVFVPKAVEETAEEITEEVSEDTAEETTEEITIVNTIATVIEHVAQSVDNAYNAKAGDAFRLILTEIHKSETSASDVIAMFAPVANGLHDPHMISKLVFTSKDCELKSRIQAAIKSMMNK